MAALKILDLMPSETEISPRSVRSSPMASHVSLAEAETVPRQHARLKSPIVVCPCPIPLFGTEARLMALATRTAHLLKKFVLPVPLRDSGLLRSDCFFGGSWIGRPVDDVEYPATGLVVARVPRF